MPICNIIDRRKRPYRWRKVNAIVEPTWHDNTVADSEYVETDEAAPSYRQLEHITLQYAIRWASEFPQAMTLFIYDHDDGLYFVASDGKKEKIDHAIG